MLSILQELVFGGQSLIASSPLGLRRESGSKLLE
jgi:hypothetical protein